MRHVANADRTHDVDLAVKDTQANLNVEAKVHEIDLDADGVCDDVVVVLDPIGTGGDADALTTFYIAGKNGWKRIGARSAASDRPVDLDLINAPADQDVAFSDFAVMRPADRPRTFIVAWRHDRITNGFAGYRIFELDTPAVSLLVFTSEKPATRAVSSLSLPDAIPLSTHTPRVEAGDDHRLGRDRSVHD